MHNYEETTVFPESEAPIPEEILSDDTPVAAIECDYREDTIGELCSEKEAEYKEVLKNIKK